METDVAQRLDPQILRLLFPLLPIIENHLQKYKTFSLVFVLFQFTGNDRLFINMTQIDFSPTKESQIPQITTKQLQAK